MVRDNPEKHRFELEVEGHTAVTVYQRTPGVITFIHTEVPDALAGKGVGSALAKGALDLVRKSGDKVVAKCPFIRAYIEKHPEFQDLLAR
jgi:predicted GNAT family acetyltransferase